MVKQQDFNRDMGSYLRKREDKGSFLDKFKMGSTPKVEILRDDGKDDVPVEHVEMVMRGEELPEEADEEEPLSIIHVPWYRRMFTFELGRRNRDDSEDDVDTSFLDDSEKPSIDGDVKEMLRICVHWVNMLPPEDIQEIKRSDDYQKFKEVLGKYGLLKKKS